MKVRCKWDCDDGWYREPDGYGCVQWTLCGPCNGTGFMEVSDDEERNSAVQQKAGIRVMGRISTAAENGRAKPRLDDSA